MRGEGRGEAEEGKRGGAVHLHVCVCVSESLQISEGRLQRQQTMSKCKSICRAMAHKVCGIISQKEDCNTATRCTWPQHSPRPKYTTQPQTQQQRYQALQCSRPQGNNNPYTILHMDTLTKPKMHTKGCKATMYYKTTKT